MRPIIQAWHEAELAKKLAAAALEREDVDLISGTVTPELERLRRARRDLEQEAFTVPLSPEPAAPAADEG